MHKSQKEKKKKHAQSLSLVEIQMDDRQTPLQSKTKDHGEVTKFAHYIEHRWLNFIEQLIKLFLLNTLKIFSRK